MWSALFFVLLIGFGIGFRFLPWYAKLAVLGVLVLAVVIFRERLLIFLFTLPFRWKGKTLRRATVQVHSLEPTDQPDFPQEDFFDEEGQRLETPPEPPRRYFKLQVTISPLPQNCVPFMFWEVGELCLVTPEENVMTGSGPNDSCVIYSNRVDRPAQIPPPELQPDAEPIDDDYGYKVFGPHRVHLVIGVKEGVSKLGFQYYFERFGEIEIPPPAATSTATN
jgi:hypothetical protein